VPPPGYYAVLGTENAYENPTLAKHGCAPLGAQA